MMTSNSSPLLKDSQKTKGIIWKPLIAVSLLSVFSFTAGQYLPYVIAAVSGSGAIAAVPLAIFAVSTVVALISTIYLIRLAVSRADNKKEAGLSREESDQQHTKCQEPTHGTNLESKPIGEEFNKLVKQNRGTQTEVVDSEHVDPPPPSPFPQGAAPPPPPPLPPEGLKNWNPSKNNPTGEKPSVGTTQENTSHPKKFIPQGGGKQPNGIFMAELHEKLKSRRKGISGKQEDDVQQPNNLTEVFGKILDRIPPPRSRSDSVSSNSSEEPEQDWSDEENECSKPQSFHKERSESPDSGHGSDDNVKPKSTPPPHSAPKADKPLISPKPVNLKTKSEAPPATTVTEVKNSSTRSVKGLTEMFENLGSSPVFSS